MINVGLISDTHGLMRPEALNALKGVDHIIHAGDVGRPEILQTLGELAPITAVRGNVDFGAWTTALPSRATITLGGCNLYILHILSELAIDLEALGVNAVIYGHTHKPSIEQRGGIFYVNPGSAGPRRFALPVSVGCLRIGENGIQAFITNLDV